MLFAAGLPIFFLEIAIGQYAGVGPIKLFGRPVTIISLEIKRIMIHVFVLVQ